MRDRLRFLSLAALFGTMAVLAFFYVPYTTPAPAGIFGYGIGEFLLWGNVSITHGFASLAYVVSFALLALAFAKHFTTAHRALFLLIVGFAAFFAVTDWNEFLGAYSPLVSVGTDISIVLGAWLGALTVGVVR